ncbi:MAG TPA: aminotransferase class IV [Solirubrobacteraceae bacterium]|jgi:branched-chain amino acid aminotransferase|nr:aminotransferase class IV [Solirubrobacteraceae bacterium]
MSPTGPTSLASLDGEIMPAVEAMIPVTDEGLIRGDGVFEVLRVYDGTPYAFDAHLARMERSAENLRLGVDLESVRADAFRLLAEAGTGPDHQCLRIMITRGGRRILLTEQMVAVADNAQVMSITYSPTRLLDGIKSLSYAANMLAGRLAREQGYDEALLVTPHGRVLEAPTSSIFYVRDGRLLTPPLDEHILASITRALVIEVTGAQEQACTLEELYDADEVFLASTVREVQTVASIDGREYTGPSPVSDRTRDAVTVRIAEQLRG